MALCSVEGFVGAESFAVFHVYLVELLDVDAGLLHCQLRFAPAVLDARSPAHELPHELSHARVLRCLALGIFRSLLTGQITRNQISREVGSGTVAGLNFLNIFLVRNGRRGLGLRLGMELKLEEFVVVLLLDVLGEALLVLELFVAALQDALVDNTLVLFFVHSRVSLQI